MTASQVKDAAGNGSLTEAEREDRALLEALLNLGEKRATSEDLTQQGDKLILPLGWDEGKAIAYLVERAEMLSEVTEFGRTFKYRENDGAAAVHRALGSVFGTAGIARPIWSFFGVDRPELRSVNVGVGEQMQVAWGKFDVPLFNGSLYTTTTEDPELGTLFRCVIYAERRYKAHVEALFEVIATELRERSIYRGKAITGAATPDFIDVESFDESEVVYSEQVWTDLNAHLWSMMRHTATMRKRKLPLKRAVLFDGDYGTGKTLAAKYTGKIAVENGWTVIYCRPGRDNLLETMQTARLYPPAIVVFEDLDTVASSGERVDVSTLLDVFDGMTAKGTELAAVLTTNKREEIVKGMLRPGRLDALITFGGLDAKGVEDLAVKLIGADQLGDEIDWEAVHGACDGYSPAFVREAIDRTKRYAVAREDGDFDALITEKDLLDAAQGLREQYELMNDAGEGERLPTIESSIGRVVDSRLDGAGVMRGDDLFGRLAKHDD